MLLPSIKNNKHELNPFGFDFDDFFMNPFGGRVSSLFDDLEDVNKKIYGNKATRLMATDVKESDEGYEVDVNIPGFKKDQISLSLNNGYLLISVEKSIDNNEEKKGKLIRHERYSGSMQRSFYVGEDIKEEDIKAKFEHGVLKLNIPKKEVKEEVKTHTIAIE